jgi:predicted lipoprotein with Yx(FWY)xxD motif
MHQFLRIRVPLALAGLLCSAIACGGSYDTSTQSGPTLKLATSDVVGNHLVDGNGRALYYFGEDLPASGASAAVSNCSGVCAATWPSFHAANNIVKGINASDVGEITRADGSKQTTYLGWPLYHYAGDTEAGDINGEGVGSIWFVLHDKAYSVALLSTSRPEPQPYLAEGTGRSLYFFTHDTVGTSTTAPVSACTSADCVSRFPIFLDEQPLVPSALSVSDFSVFTRPDGQKQSAYKGHPLYFFSGDASVGQTNARGFNGAWDTVNPSAF